MGQNNQCCTLPLTQNSFNLDEIRIYWPNVADEVANLRRLNKTITLAVQNTQHEKVVQKKFNTVYKQFITSEYCFFGYFSPIYQNLQTQSDQSQKITYKQSRDLSKRKGCQRDKQNFMFDKLIPSKFELNDFAILIHKEKTCYKGYFYKNKFHGNGYLSDLQNQSQFQGIFQNGNKKNGIYQNKEVKYQGELSHNEFEGKGKIQFKSTGDFYEGQFYRGKMHGKGKLIYKNGDFYEGQFQNGLYHGQGIYCWRQGQIFKGSYKKGKKHGFGTLTMQGKVHELCWVNDKAQAKPLNYTQFKTQKQIEISKSKKTMKRIKQHAEDDKDQATSILNHGAKTELCIV